MKRDRRSLTRRLSKAGKIRLTNDLKLIKARKRFVVDLVPLKDVAEELQLPLSTLQRWSHLHCWDDARAERERAMILRVQGVRRALVPDIDRKHDEMFASLEQLLEVTLKELQDSGAPIPPHHLKTLASTLVACQAGRRTVHQKEQSVSRKVIELRENPEVYESFVQSLADLASRSNGRQLSGTGSSLSLSVMDAEFEELGEEAANAGREEES